MLLVGAGILDYLPRPVMGGLLMYLGTAILIEQLYDEWFKVPKSDHFVIVLILVVTGLLGYLHGILAGLVAGLVLFVVNYSRVSLIKVELSGATYSSNVERTETARNFLKENGERIYILKLQGYLFFGTANRLLRRVRHRTAMAGLPPLRYLVLDFRLVNGLDSSALISFLKIGQMAVREQFVVVVTNLNADLRTQLEKGSFLGELTSEVQAFPGLGNGLEWCEDNMLVVENMFEISQQVVPLQPQLKRAFSNGAHAKGIMKYLEKRTVEHGEYLMRQAEPSNELYFVESGRVSIQLDLPDGGTRHIRTMGPGTLVGETAFMLGGDRTSGAVAETRSVVYCLTTRSLRKMVREHPVLASTMYGFMARMLAERLVSSSRILKAAME